MQKVVGIRTCNFFVYSMQVSTILGKKDGERSGGCDMRNRDNDARSGIMRAMVDDDSALSLQ